MTDEQQQVEAAARDVYAFARLDPSYAARLAAFSAGAAWQGARYAPAVAALREIERHNLEGFASEHPCEYELGVVRSALAELDGEGHSDA